MKIFGTIAKIVVALAAVAGLVYVAATYGDKIVAWAKKVLGICKGCCEGDVIIDEADEVVIEEAPVEEPVATEADFEG